MQIPPSGRQKVAMSMKTVFLSSTAKDLAEYREAATQAINGLDDYKCVRMEDFGARDAMSDEFCRSKVTDCDVFVGILGHCYGSRPEGSAKSFTEQEYDAAVVTGRPRLLFLAREDFRVPAHLIESDESRDRQCAFRKRVSSERMRDTFTSPDDLAWRVVRGIRNWEQEAGLSVPTKSWTTEVPLFPEGEPDSGVLTHARDVEICYRLMPEKTVIAELRGLVTRTTSRGALIFIRLLDATGSIQLVCDRSVLPHETWELVRKVRPLDRVRVRGRVGLTERKTLSIFVELIEEFLPRTISDRDVLDADQRGLTTQFFLARIRLRATHYFREASFEEFEPSYLSASLEESRVEPLRVVFPGFGANAYLVPSPAMQLWEAVLITANPKVFCVSRCFSAAIRDGYTSAESMILCARQLGASLEGMCELAENAVKTIFGHFTTMPNTLQAWLGPQSWPIKKCQLASIEVAVKSPEIHILEIPRNPTGRMPNDMSMFRICWPPPGSSVVGNVVVAEGHVASVEENIVMGGITLHLERMVPVLRDVTLRRLRHLGVRP